MLQMQSLFRVCDNSGAKKLRCIKVLGGFKRKYAKVGDLIVVSVRRVKQHKKKIKVKEGDVTRAVIVRLKSTIRRSNYTHMKWRENAAVVLANRSKPVATRILGPVAKEIRLSKYLKLVSLASGTV